MPTCVVYVRLACRSECGRSTTVLQADTLVAHYQVDVSTPLINHTLRGHQDWPLICRVVIIAHGILSTERNVQCAQQNNRWSLLSYTGGIPTLFPWPVKTGKIKLLYSRPQNSRPPVLLPFSLRELCSRFIISRQTTFRKGKLHVSKHNLGEWTKVRKCTKLTSEALT